MEIFFTLHVWFIEWPRNVAKFLLLCFFTRRFRHKNRQRKIDKMCLSFLETKSWHGQKNPRIFCCLKVNFTWFRKLAILNMNFAKVCFRITISRHTILRKMAYSRKLAKLFREFLNKGKISWLPYNRNSPLVPALPTQHPEATPACSTDCCLTSGAVVISSSLLILLLLLLPLMVRLRL
jgi:hypothetical protein